MARITARLTLLEAAFGLVVLAVVGRAAELQLFQGSTWKREAEQKRRVKVVLPAKRGGIFDRNGVALALTQEYYHVGVAPNELDDRGAAIKLLARSLEIPLGRVQRDFASGKKWLYYFGPFTALQVQALQRTDGVHLEGEFARHYPAGPLARAVIGGLDPDRGDGASGVELALDSLLTGIPGEAVALKDRAGKRYESPSRLTREPVAGHDVTLTIDAELQEIAERGLEDAITQTSAVGGDVVFLDPRSGELLALASRQRLNGELVSSRASFLTDPFEPGSTAKLFTAAALLALKKVSPTDEVYGEEGKWVMPVSSKQTRPITDAHAVHGNLTLAMAIEVSSNIAMAKFSQRLSATQQYDGLRDFGFGSPTGVEFPSESRGRLPAPNLWKPGFNGPSVAMGYSFGVTPVQLAAAYGAIANGGVLLTPTLVREVRDPEGAVGYRHKPEPVRRAATPEVAAQLRRFLAGAVGEGGTGERAQLANYSLIGKTGTAVRFVDGRYVQGSYCASFAAVFPAEDPQLVAIVKLDDPKGKNFGGETAAPLTKSMLQEALAARRSAIDRSRLAAGVIEDTTTPIAPVQPEKTRTVVVAWPAVRDSSAKASRLPVPDVRGTNLRRAAYALHRRGFQVAVHGSGKVSRTTPAAGDSLATGLTVTVWAE